MTRTAFAAVLAGLSLMLFAPVAQAESRVALVIGNSAYQNTPALANPGNDADDMAAALKRVGFTVHLEHNLDKRGMERATAQFAREARDADAALFYYAGHGLQHRGLNYLMPTDAKLDDEFSVNFEMTRLEDVLQSLDQARGVKILVLDACRRNPLVDRLAGKATTRDFAPTRGLARLDATRGMVVAYSTQPDQVAVDGAGRNSPFTAALVREISEPGLEIGTLFRRVAADVNHATGGRQLPELSVSLLGEFYFSSADSDVQAWAKVRASQDRGKLRDFLDRYPSSPLVLDIGERLEAIERTEKARLDRERAETERLERERLAREQAERDRRDQAERERLGRERPERERVAREQAEQKQREQAERDRLASAQVSQQIIDQAAPTAPADKTQTAMLTPPSAPLPAAPRPLAGGALVQEIKKELRRVGCYGGPIDEKWPTSEAMAAAKKFATYATLPTPKMEPTIELLDAIRGKSERVCPLECDSHQVEKDGRCIAKSCPKGLNIDDNGNCTRPPKAPTRPADASLSQPEPSSTHPRVFTAEPPRGSGAINHGENVYVDDGSCGNGQIKEIIGGQGRGSGVHRQEMCVARPPGVSRPAEQAPVAGALRQEPAAGSIRTGAKVLVDDGACPRGKIKEVTGGDMASIPRLHRCVARN
ncbi:MAG TPA: DUF6719 family protein [Xanthobacteraceae bacterium]